MYTISSAFERVIKKLFDQDIHVELTRPDEQFGDYATNAALQLAGKLGKPPREIAQAIADELKAAADKDIKDVTIAGPGFINVTLSDSALLAHALSAPTTKPTTYKDKVVVAEYSDPNPFKVLHAGHLYTSVVGDSIANLFEVTGATVHRVNFGGDVGRHVARNMWAIIKNIGGEQPEKLADVPEAKRSEWMSKRYVEGTEADETSEESKAEITDINKRVYQAIADQDHQSPFAQVYWTCRQWSYDYFDQFYARIGTHFEKFYPESATTPLGLQTVREQLAKGVYEQSDGAIVFKGEPYGLHTRVFINSHGLPTYEGKDIGLIMTKWQDYHFDVSLIITGNDIIEYMKVVLKSVEQFMPELAKNTIHVTHGMVKLQGGVKMSSRKGNFLRATDVLDAAAAAATESRGETPGEELVLAAVKYAFLKNRIGGDTIYNPTESVSLEGNSGPYLQYAHARARSILAKSKGGHADKTELEAGERSLARKIAEYPEALERAAAELMPHHICTYLYELAQTFNRFYENSRVIGDPREAQRVQLVGLYADVLKDGLVLLNIAAPEHL